MRHGARGVQPYSAPGWEKPLLWRTLRRMRSARRLDPIYLLDEIAARKPKSAAFDARTLAAARSWQRRTRKRLAAIVGFLDQSPVPLRPRVVETVDRGEYVRRKVILRTTQWSDLPLYLLEPKGTPRPGPVVLALHGHGYGVKDIVGLWEDGSERREPDGYHRDFGCELARRGFVVAAPEISCFGERASDYEHLKKTLQPTTCHNAGTYAMMLGKSIAGLRVWDAMRAVDYLATLKTVNISRLGAMGISGGGLHAFFSTALDLRIQACVISGYFCDWRHSVLAMNHCTCNFIPGLLEMGELSDLAGLIAPRPCLVENGTRDDIFPIEHVKRTVSKARRAWSIFGASADLEADYFAGRHAIGGAKAYDFLGRSLGAGAGA